MNPIFRHRALSSALFMLLVIAGAKSVSAQSLQDVATSIESGSFDDALATFEAVDAGSELESDTYRNVASALFRAGGNSQAVAVLETGLQNYPDAARFHFLIGFIHADSGDCVAALPAFERFIGAMPGDPDGYYQMGTCYAVLGRDDDARVSLLRYLELESRDDRDDQIMATHTLLEDLTLDEDWNAASEEEVASEESSVVEQPAESELTSTLSFASFDAAMDAAADFVVDRQWRMASQAYAAAAQLDGNSVEAWYKLGVTRAISGDALGARDAFRRTRQLDPGVPGIDDLVRAAEARVEYEARTAIDPPGYFTDEDVRQGSREVAFASRNWLLGIRAELGVPLDEVWTAAVDRALLEGRLDEARTIAVLAIGESPSDLDRYLRAADVHRISGDVAGAQYFMRLYLDFGGDVVAAAPIRSAIDLLGDPNSP